MLDRLFGESASRILLYLDAVEEGCAPEIAANFDFVVSAIQRQLRNFEHAGVLSSRLIGNVRIYTFNPRYPFLPELRSLLRRAREYLPDEEQKRYYSPRTRPRRAGKPL